MASLGSDQATTSLFCYQNKTNQTQVIKVEQRIPQRFEKIVFSGERILFYSTPDTVLEIHTPATTSLSVLERVPCAQLQVIESGV